MASAMRYVALVCMFVQRCIAFLELLTLADTRHSAILDGTRGGVRPPPLRVSKVSVVELSEKNSDCSQ